MTVFLFLLPWSIGRQLHADEVTRTGLLELPLIFAAVDLSTDADAIGYLAVSLALSVAFGLWLATTRFCATDEQARNRNISPRRSQLTAPRAWAVVG